MSVVTTSPQIYTALEKHVAGYIWIFEGFPWNVAFPVANLGDVTLVDAKLHHNFEDESTPVWMVFSVEGELWKLVGFKDSYGGSSWNTELKKVKKREVVEYVYA
jgi:hypothetical protein